MRPSKTYQETRDTGTGSGNQDISDQAVAAVTPAQKQRNFLGFSSLGRSYFLFQEVFDPRFFFLPEKEEGMEAVRELTRLNLKRQVLPFAIFCILMVYLGGILMGPLMFLGDFVGILLLLPLALFIYSPFIIFFMAMECHPAFSVGENSTESENLQRRELFYLLPLPAKELVKDMTRYFRQLMGWTIVGVVGLFGLFFLVGSLVIFGLPSFPDNPWTVEEFRGAIFSFPEIYAYIIFMWVMLDFFACLYVWALLRNHLVSYLTARVPFLPVLAFLKNRLISTFSAKEPFHYIFTFLHFLYIYLSLSFFFAIFGFSEFFKDQPFAPVIFESPAICCFFFNPIIAFVLFLGLSVHLRKRNIEIYQNISFE